MKQIVKLLGTALVLMAVSACAQTSANNDVFSDYRYAPAASYNSYNYAPEGYVVAVQPTGPQTIYEYSH